MPVVVGSHQQFEWLGRRLSADRCVDVIVEQSRGSSSRFTALAVSMLGSATNGLRNASHGPLPRAALIAC